MKVSVSFIKSLYDEEVTIKKINNSLADYIHVDIMDGKFVKVKNYDFTTINYLFNDINKDLDIHLMVENPLDEVKKYCLLNPKYITFHIEAASNPKEIIDYVHSKNIKVGIAINPDTSVNMIKPYLNDIDLVLVMSVNPGYGGQKFIMNTINKINELNELKKDFIISVDGGINDEIVKLINVDMVVSGAFVCESDNFDNQINKLKLN